MKECEEEVNDKWKWVCEDKLGEIEVEEVEQKAEQKQ